MVHNFDKKLKYVQFDVIRDSEPTDPNNNANVPKVPNAFDALMSKSTQTRLPQKIDETSPRFTGTFNLYALIIFLSSRFEMVYGSCLVGINESVPHHFISFLNIPNLLACQGWLGDVKMVNP